MNVVGRVGSLISQGVYSVATPFHPFGGAVDIIVVEQQDGTYRSTPWYVRFGKFQGIIKGAEKVVTISVNGVEADFHMHLDNSGQAFFMREVESSETQSSSQTSVESCPHKLTHGDNTDSIAEVQETVHEEHRQDAEVTQVSDELPHELKDDNSSSNHSSTASPRFGAYNSEVVLISVDGHVLTAPVSENEEESTEYVQSTNPQFLLGPGEGSREEFNAIFGDLDASAFNDGNPSQHLLEGSKEAQGNSICEDETREKSHIDTRSSENTGDGASVSHEINDTSHTGVDTSPEDIHARRRHDDMFKSCLDLTSHIQGYDSQDMGSVPENNPKEASGVFSINGTVEEEHAARDGKILGDDALECPSTLLGVSENGVSGDSEQEPAVVKLETSIQNSEAPVSEHSPVSDNIIDSSEKVSNTENTRHLSSADSTSDVVEPGGSTSRRSYLKGECSDFERDTSISGFGFELSLCGNLLRPGIGHSSAEEAFEAHHVSEEQLKACGPSIIKNGNLIIRYKGSYFTWEKAAYVVLGKAAFGAKFSEEPKDPIPLAQRGTPKEKEDSPASRGWRLWPIPFRRSPSLQHSISNASSEEFFVDSESALQSPTAEQMSNGHNNKSPRQQFIHTYIPTNEQIASLNLKDGQNKIAFSFSTRVFGKQEVDAHIYLWKWNARIVISDVDGTITKSDVLGQVMPLVGRDWSQSGVAGLFSAIKENGYQLLFLSARAIVQAYLTRSFLQTLKQDGKALPSGPVVISPDGLFPSLYREVIRRAPHEFKIACLEDIKALFPCDYNPFYAGFGNRNTDELSYRKIGIPKGKIFIINPKGEVVINHCIDVKSYTSLHTLVNDMFPPTSLVEQEDFNSWNYWKMPLPYVD